MKKIPASISDFKKIILGDYVYVDKTDYLYHLVKDEGHYLLTRPRRFGKSLLLSTLEFLFRGERELFKNLKIGSTDYNFAKYPVLFLTMTG